jgi:hypothetical protein
MAKTNPVEQLRVLRTKREQLQKQIDDAHKRINPDCPIATKKLKERTLGMYATLVHFDKRLKLTANQIIGKGCWNLTMLGRAYDQV